MSPASFKPYTIPCVGAGLLMACIGIFQVPIQQRKLQEVRFIDQEN